MEQNATYLEITIHDNDFWSSQMHLANLLQQIFKCEGYPTEKDLPYLQEFIGRLWYEIYSVEYILEEHKLCWTDASYFDFDLKFIEFKDIPNWDNYENVYIPMFDGEIIVR